MLTCYICGALVAPDDAKAHLDAHETGLFVNVWTLRAELAVSVGGKVSVLASETYTDSLRTELLDVLDDYGAGVNMSGRYYVTPAMIASGRYPLIAAAVQHGRWEPA